MTGVISTWWSSIIDFTLGDVGQIGDRTPAVFMSEIQNSFNLGHP